MEKAKIVYWKDLLLAVVISVIGYIILKSTVRTGLVDMSVELVLWFVASMIALRGFSKSTKTINKNFRRFELFYGFTYFCTAVSFIMGLYYFIKNPAVIEIGVADIVGNNWLIIMSSIKSFSVIFLIVTWSYFYKYLNIKASRGKKIVVFVIGVSLYLGSSILIWQLTKDINVLSLGIIVGCVIGIFALIAQDRRARYLTMIFTIYSCIHLIEFYLMGIGRDLTTGLNNPFYWGVTVLYILEIRRWINRELNREKG